MCGYCIERVMIEFLEQELCSKAPIPEDQGSAMILESYAQETGFPMHSLKFARAWDKESDILYVLHCRALEEIATRPASATSGSQPHNALVKHYHAYRRMASTRFKTVELENILPHPSWLILYDPDFVFSEIKWSEFTANPDLLDQCAALLKRYHSWWLKGEGQIKNDLHQRLEETGIMDPIEDIASSEWDTFYRLFPVLYFALVYLGNQSYDSRLLENIALTPPNGVPDFPGFDLLLRRRALILSIQAQGTKFLLDNLGSSQLYLDLIYYAFLRLKTVRSNKERIIAKIKELGKEGQGLSPDPQEVQEHLDKIRNCPDTLEYQ